MRANHYVSARTWENQCESVEFASTRTNAHIRICVLLDNNVAFSHDVLCYFDLLSCSAIFLPWLHVVLCSSAAVVGQPKYKINKAKQSHGLLSKNVDLLTCFAPRRFGHFRLLLYIKKYTGR